MWVAPAASYCPSRAGELPKKPRNLTNFGMGNSELKSCLRSRLFKEKGTVFFKAGKYEMARKKYDKIVEYLEHEISLKDDQEDERKDLLQAGASIVVTSISLNIITGLPTYSDTGYSDIPATVTDFWSIKGSPYIENPGYSDILLTVTLLGRPNPVTVSGEACN